MDESISGLSSFLLFIPPPARCEFIVPCLQRLLIRFHDLLPILTSTTNQRRLSLFTHRLVRKHAWVPFDLIFKRLSNNERARVLQSLIDWAQSHFDRYDPSRMMIILLLLSHFPAAEQFTLLTKQDYIFSTADLMAAHASLPATSRTSLLHHYFQFIEKEDYIDLIKDLAPPEDKKLITAIVSDLLDENRPTLDSNKLFFLSKCATLKPRCQWLEEQTQSATNLTNLTKST